MYISSRGENLLANDTKSVATELDNEEEEAREDGDNDENKDSGLEDAASDPAEVISEKDATSSPVNEDENTVFDAVCSTESEDLYDGICWCNDFESEDFDSVEGTDNDGELIDPNIDSEGSKADDGDFKNEFEVL